MHSVAIGQEGSAINTNHKPVDDMALPQLLVNSDSCMLASRHSLSYGQTDTVVRTQSWIQTRCLIIRVRYNMQCCET